MKCLGIDPGTSTALALVEHTSVGRLPRLLGLHIVYGAEWYVNLEFALDELIRLGGPDLVAVEKLQPILRATAGVRHHRAAAGLAEARGVVLGMLAGRYCGEVWNCTTGEWTGALRVRTGKSGDGLHRLSEAVLLVDGARSELAALPSDSRAALDRRIDAAEAILIAAAGVAELRGRAVARRVGGLGSGVPTRRRHEQEHQTSGHQPERLRQR